MTLAKRGLALMIAVLLGTSLCLGLLPIRDVAYAASTDKTLSATKSAVKKNPYSTTPAKRIAVAAAVISYSRATYKGQGVGTAKYFAALKKYSTWYYWHDNKQMQCNVPVSVAVRLAFNSKKKYPKFNREMYDYMKSSKDWKCLGNYSGNESMLKPGDVLARIAGVTTYRDKNGRKCKATIDHTCIYVGKKIATSVYNRTLKGTDADKGKPGSKRVFVSAHTSSANPSHQSASCLEKASEAFADNRMLVFRYVGK